MNGIEWQVKVYVKGRRGREREKAVRSGKIFLKRIFELLDTACMSYKKMSVESVHSIRSTLVDHIPRIIE